jgi:hypothetical protein
MNRRIQLTDAEIEQAKQAAVDTVAIANKLTSRLAEPHERKEVGRRLDPNAAHVFLVYAYVLDPYGDDPDLPDEFRTAGRTWFAVDPFTGIAVHFDDLPEETRNALEAKRDAANADGWRRLLAPSEDI